jgi:hypothetical protein
MDTQNASSGFKQACPKLNRDVGVTESKTLDAIAGYYYWNETKLILYTIEQPHGNGSSRHCYSRSLCSSLLSKLQTVPTFALCDMYLICVYVCPP